MSKIDSPVKTHLKPPLPEPLFTMPYQNGITDPLWPETYPASFDPGERAKFYKAQVEEDRLEQSSVAIPAKNKLEKTYLSEYAGRVARQDFQSAVRIDVNARTRDELKKVLQQISSMVIDETEKKASANHLRAFDPIPDSYRVTITVAFGASLFVDATGFDRFGLSAQRPKSLKIMPSFPGDHQTLNPERAASDLMLVITSDHPYVNVAIVRYFAEFFNEKFSAAHHPKGKAYNVLTFRGVEEGFARKDKREFLRFDDGVENLHIDPRELRRLVYVDPSDSEPPWCCHGSYLVYRKVRERMPVWEAIPEKEQSQLIGRDKATSMPLSKDRAGHDEMTPVFPGPRVEAGVRLNAHIRKVQPRRPSPDLFGLNDLERRFLRRPYPFFDGLDENGQAINGLHFMAFMKNIQQQFEHVVNMWQMNPDFPVPGIGADALYAKGILSTIDGGYYFCPPGLKDRNDYFGSGMFDQPAGGA